ncbi:MAG: hypothetical protein C4526_01185 [Nitrospiraceae bacterium]|nr:MAG: hypothetical protein C4526_01185 [Nitrospiraceae bacterium]
MPQIKALALFHHKKHNNSMKVVEKDKVIGGMLGDELKRCQEMFDSLERSVAGLPKGSLNERKKRYKGKVYSYFYLKYRDGKKVISKHISNKEVQEISKKLELRKKYEKEIQSYKKKISYLNKITKTGNKRGHGDIAKK